MRICCQINPDRRVMEKLEPRWQRKVRNLLQLKWSMHIWGEGEELAVRLKDIMKEKHKDLSKSSRTSALCWSYVRYVSIIQDFIRAERTNDWNLYLQFIAELEKNQPEVYNEFLKGSHTVRRALKSWAGIWTDLSIEQILMKSLKGRAGVVTKGISETENVMHVWTKTMHRCAEITETMDSIVSIIQTQGAVCRKS